MTINVNPTARMACAREGGSTKFGGPPAGLGAIGIVVGSKLCGKESIARQYLGKMINKKCQAEEKQLDKSKCMSCGSFFPDILLTITTTFTEVGGKSFDPEKGASLSSFVCHLKSCDAE